MLCVPQQAQQCYHKIMHEASERHKKLRGNNKRRDPARRKNNYKACGWENAIDPTHDIVLQNLHIYFDISYCHYEL